MCLRCADARPPRVAPTLTVPLPICMHVLRSWVPPVVGDRSPHGTPGTPKLEGSPGPNGTPTAPRTLDAHTAKAASGGRAVPASGGGTPELPTRLRARTQRSAAPPKLPTQVDDAFPLVSGDDGGVFVQGEGTKSGQRQNRAAAVKETADVFPLVSGDDGGVFVQGGATNVDQRQGLEATDRTTSVRVRPTSDSVVSVADVAGKLKDLVQMLDRNLISEQEFFAVKKDLLDRVNRSQSVSTTPSPKSAFASANARAARSPADASKSRSSAQPILWDDSAFSRTLVAAAAKLSVLVQPAPGVVPAPADSTVSGTSEPERMAKWNRLCQDQMQKSSRAEIIAGNGTILGGRAISQEPPVGQHSPSVPRPVASTVQTYNSANPMLGPLDFLTTSLNAVSTLGIVALVILADYVESVSENVQTPQVASLSRDTSRHTSRNTSANVTPMGSRSTSPARQRESVCFSPVSSHPLCLLQLSGETKLDLESAMTGSS